MVGLISRVEAILDTLTCVDRLYFGIAAVYEPLTIVGNSYLGTVVCLGFLPRLSHPPIA